MKKNNLIIFAIIAISVFSFCKKEEKKTIVENNKKELQWIRVIKDNTDSATFSLNGKIIKTVGINNKHNDFSLVDTTWVYKGDVIKIKTFDLSSTDSIIANNHIVLFNMNQTPGYKIFEKSFTIHDSSIVIIQ